MKGDLPLAAQRLLCSLPCRTHERRLDAYSERESANNVRECVINGVRYESLAEAARQLHRSRETLRRALAERGGRYEPANPRGRGGHNARAIIIGAERFGSMSEARAALGIALKTLHAMISEGRARYAGKHE